MSYRSENVPNVVVIGGGTGLSVMLRGLKKAPMHITAIVTVADDGGSSGVLRSQLNMPPPGDIRNVLLALADAEPMLAKMLQYRFANGEGLAGHSLGNLILAAMKDITGDFVTAIKELSRVLAVRGEVLPAASHAIVLKAEMEDGTIISGESKIPLSGKRIQRVFLEDMDRIKPLDAALEAIDQADGIIIGPGSLYTSILPNLLVPGIADAVKKAKAAKIFVCNVMTQPGETDGYSVYDHLRAVETHVGGKLVDVVLVNNGDVPTEFIKKYKALGAEPVASDIETLVQQGYQVIADHLIIGETYLRHDADRLTKHIVRLVEPA